MTFGEKLQTLRRERGLSQEALAEQLRVSRQAVSKWELDAARPDIDNVLALAALFEVSTDYLLLDQPPRSGKEGAFHDRDYGPAHRHRGGRRRMVSHRGSGSAVFLRCGSGRGLPRGDHLSVARRLPAAGHRRHGVPDMGTIAGRSCPRRKSAVFAGCSAGSAGSGWHRCWWR